MDLNEVSYNEGTPVDGYGPGFFRIGGQVVEAPLVLLPTGIGAWGGLDDEATLLGAEGLVDVLLIGMGAEIAHLPRSLADKLDAKGIGADVMSSAQACRTYNVLLGEGRRIGLALLPI